MTQCGISLGQLGLAVPAVLPPMFLSTLNILSESEGRVRNRESSDAV